MDYEEAVFVIMVVVFAVVVFAAVAAYLKWTEIEGDAVPEDVSVDVNVSTGLEEYNSEGNEAGGICGMGPGSQCVSVN